MHTDTLSAPRLVAPRELRSMVGGSPKARSGA